MNGREEPPDRLGVHIFGPQDLPFRFKHSTLDVMDETSTAANDQRLIEFRGWVVIQDASDALAAAFRANEVAWSERALVLWADASRSFKVDGDGNGDGSSGYAVAAVDQSSRWMGKLGHTYETDVASAELCAISAALDMAVDEIKRLRARGRLLGPAGPLVKIFSDCQTALKVIKALPDAPRRHEGRLAARMQIILARIGSQSHELERLGSGLMLQWVPRGKVTGNKIADGLAKSVRRRYEIYVNRMVNVAERALEQMDLDEAERETTKLGWTTPSL